MLSRASLDWLFISSLSRLTGMHRKPISDDILLAESVWDRRDLTLKDTNQQPDQMEVIAPAHDRHKSSNAGQNRMFLHTRPQPATARYKLDEETIQLPNG